MRTLDIFKNPIMRFIFWAAVIGLALNAVRIHLPTLKAALLPAKVVPYTVVLQEFQLQRDGTAVPSLKLTEAIRGDGSHASQMTDSNPANPPSTERILEFSSGKQMYIFDRWSGNSGNKQHQQLKTTTFDPAKNLPAHWLRDSANSCLISGFQEKSDGEEVIDGYRAVKLTRGSTTHWFALDYGCGLIKDRYEWPDGQKSEKRLVSLIPGEPARSLFDDPAGFQEVPPSRWLPPQADISAQDAYYESHRPPNGTPRAE